MMILPNENAMVGAFNTVATILVLNCVGALLAVYPRSSESSAGSNVGDADPIARRGVLTQTALQQVSRLCIVCLLPCRIATSLGKGLTPDKAKQAWMMLMCCWIQIAIAVVTALIIRAIVQPPKHLKRAFLCAIIFQNSSAIPLVICQSLAEQPPFSDDTDAFEKIALYVFVYNIGWQWCFWCLGFPYLTSDPEAQGKDSSIVKSIIQKGVLNPVFLSSILGVVIALTPPLHMALFSSDGGLRFVGSAAEILGLAAVPVITCVTSGTLGKSFLRWRMARNHHDVVETTTNTTNNTYTNTTMNINTNATVNSNTLELDEDNIMKEELAVVTAEPNANLQKIPIRLMIILGASRLILVGSVQFMVTSWLLPIFPNGTELMQLVVLIECSAPTANMVIVSSQNAGMRRAAEDLSTALLFQSFLGFVTMVGYVSMAVTMTMS